MQSPTTTPRSPVNFWLLLAATLAFDVVAFTWFFTSNGRTAAGTLFDALSFSQMSVACIWWLQSTPRRAWKAVVPILVAAAAATAMAQVPSVVSIVDVAALCGSHLVALTAALWIATRTTWFQPAAQKRSAWQFSVAQFLVVMTLLAILITVLKASELVRDAWPTAAGIIVGNVVLAVGALFIWRLPRPSLVRLALMLAVAAVVALANALQPPYFLGNFAAYYVIQTLVLWLWLEVGQIVPSGDAIERTESQPPTD
jgi:hypothetical protein